MHTNNDVERNKGKVAGTHQADEQFYRSVLLRCSDFQYSNVTPGSLKRSRLKYLSVIIGISDLIKN